MVGFGFAVPRLCGLSGGGVLGGGHGAGPQVFLPQRIGIERFEDFGREIGEVCGEGIERGLAGGGERGFAGGARGVPFGGLWRIKVILRRQEAGFAVEQFAEVFIEATGDAPDTPAFGAGIGMVPIQPGEVGEEEARIEADAASHHFAAIEDHLPRAVQRAIGQHILCRIAREDQRRIPPARKRFIAPLVNIGRLRRNADQLAGAADMAALRQVVEEAHLPLCGERQPEAGRRPRIIREADIPLHRYPPAPEPAAAALLHALRLLLGTKGDQFGMSRGV